MDKYIRQHEEKVVKALLENAKAYDWKKLKEIHLARIGFMQHERLIHLLVTLAFAVMTFITLAIIFNRPRAELLAVLVLLCALLIPYIFHYYFLENSVQRWYKLADKIEEKIAKNK